MLRPVAYTRHNLYPCIVLTWAGLDQGTSWPEIQINLFTFLASLIKWPENVFRNKNAFEIVKYELEFSFGKALMPPAAVWALLGKPGQANESVNPDFTT